MHHAFVIEEKAENGIDQALAWAKRELGMQTDNNPDVVVLRYGLLSAEDARIVSEKASGAPFSGEHKVIIVAASRAYHEAQNVLLKLFEEPPRGTYLFLILPSLGGLLLTLRSRVQVLRADAAADDTEITEIAKQFLSASSEKRSALIKKLTTGGDEEDRRENREEAIALLNGVERAAYARKENREVAALLADIATLRAYLYDRSAPVRMILEHVSLVTPNDLIY